MTVADQGNTECASLLLAHRTEPKMHLSMCKGKPHLLCLPLEATLTVCTCCWRTTLSHKWQQQTKTDAPLSFQLPPKTKVSVWAYFWRTTLSHK